MPLQQRWGCKRIEGSLRCLRFLPPHESKLEVTRLLVNSQDLGSTDDDRKETLTMQHRGTNKGLERICTRRKEALPK